MRSTESPIATCVSPRPSQVERKVQCRRKTEGHQRDKLPAKRRASFVQTLGPFRFSFSFLLLSLCFLPICANQGTHARRRTEEKEGGHENEMRG